MAGHHHHHSHGHGHSHASGGGSADFRRAFLIGIALNSAIVVLQVFFGVLSNSLALLADAGHNLADTLGLVVAYVATILARRAPTPRFTYGLLGSSILAALFNAVFLLVVTGGLSWEAFKRLLAPQPIESETVIAVAASAILLNGFTAWLFASGRKGDLNIRGAFLHMIADAAISAGVVAGTVLILLTGWLWLDPLIGLAINAIIIWGSWGLFRESVAMSLNAAPPGVKTEEVREFLSSRSGVVRVRDLHVWCMSTTDYALTAHLVMPSGHPGDGFLSEVSTELSHKFGIGHVTLQVETNPETECTLDAGCKRK